MSKKYVLNEPLWAALVDSTTNVVLCDLNMDHSNSDFINNSDNRPSKKRKLDNVISSPKSKTKKSL